MGGLIGVWKGLQWLDIVLAFPVALLGVQEWLGSVAREFALAGG